MNPEIIVSYLEQCLPLPIKRPLTKDESKLPLEEAIYARITSKQFRKSKVDELTEKLIKTYLHATVHKNQPIKIFLLFGGYKQSHLASFPFPEWAEIFNIQFVLQAASYIESIYPPGVTLVYRSDETVITYLNNYTRQSRQEYAQRFKSYLDLYNSYIPKDRNILIQYESVGMSSPEKELFVRMQELYPKRLALFTDLPEAEQEDRIKRAYKNQCWDGEENLTDVSEDQKRKRAKWAYIMGEAYLFADIQISETYLEQGISILFRKGVPGCLFYSSCKYSTIQFWVGEGMLIHNDQGLHPVIVSYNQKQTLSTEQVKVNSEKFNAVGLESIYLIQ